MKRKLLLGLIACVCLGFVITKQSVKVNNAGMFTLGNIEALTEREDLYPYKYKETFTENKRCTMTSPAGVSMVGVWHDCTFGITVCWPTCVAIQ